MDNAARNMDGGKNARAIVNRLDKEYKWWVKNAIREESRRRA